MSNPNSEQILNPQWRLAQIPQQGMPAAEDFSFVQGNTEIVANGQALARNIYLSLDPYQWVRRRSGTEQVGAVCHGRTVAQVVASRHEQFQEGDYLFCTLGWQAYGLVGQDVDVFGYMFPRKLDPGLAPISTAVGVMGMLGLTAYSGLIVQCDPRPGETVVVSAASGGVGQIVGQLAKVKGCRVVGIAGTEEKCNFVVNELGFDACVSHRSTTLGEDLRAACLDGCDVYFENVGGKVYQAVLPLLNHRARISLCGMIAHYDDDYFGKDGGSQAAQNNPRKHWQTLGAATFAQKQVTVHDLFVGNFVSDYQDKFLHEMAGYVRDGLIAYREDRRSGLENALSAFQDMLTGDNFGKTLVVVSEEEAR